MTSSDRNADTANHEYDTYIGKASGNVFGNDAHVANYHYGSSQSQGELEAYFNKMDQWLPSLKSIQRVNAQEKEENRAIITMAKIRTLRVLVSLDKVQKRWVLLYLYQSGLLDWDEGRDRSLFWLTDADFTNADLHGVRLKGANLNYANLNGADLSGVDLSNASLQRTNLSGANLSGADLRNVFLWETSFNDASLVNIDLRDAILISPVFFERADLSGANLSELHFGMSEGIGMVESDIRKLFGEYLKGKARSLSGATMPDGSKHP